MKNGNYKVLRIKNGDILENMESVIKKISTFIPPPPQGEGWGEGVAIVRELHTFGDQLRVGEKSDGTGQHMGF